MKGKRVEPFKFSSAYQSAADLDDFLGDPTTGGTPLSYREIVAAEERSEFPDGAGELLERWGFHRFLVPVALGGRLRALDELLLICRTLARRDMGVAVMYGSAFLAANPVWLWGDAGQRATLAGSLLGGRLACFGISEPEHGSDLNATESRLERAADGLRLTGRKWPVGNATRARFVTVLARSGTAGHSLVLVDKEAIPAGTWSALPPVRTVGLVGHDLSGIDFRRAPLPEDAFVGAPGTGLTQVLKALQITRTAIAGLSLGTMDAVLRITLRYARERRLYGAEIADIPVVRHHLVLGHLDLLIAECVALPVSRALSLAPERLSLWSSVVKYLVPTLAEECVANTAAVLGAPGYLREGVADGAFQKLRRDHAVASVFEGTTHVNLHWIAAQLPAVAARLSEEPDTGDLVTRLFDQCSDTPDWRPDGRRLRLANGGADEITQSWPLLVRRLGELTDSPVRDELLALCDRVETVRAGLYRRILTGEGWHPDSLRAQRDALTHCRLHAIASCLAMWLANRADIGGRFADGEWLVLCVQRLAASAGVDTDLDERRLATFAGAMVRRAFDPRGWSLTRLG